MQCASLDDTDQALAILSAALKSGGTRLSMQRGSYFSTQRFGWLASVFRCVRSTVRIPGKVQYANT